MDTSKPSTSAISQSEALSNVYSENNALYQDKLQLMDQIEQLKEQLAAAQVLFFYCSFLYIERI